MGELQSAAGLGACRRVKSRVISGITVDWSAGITQMAARRVGVGLIRAGSGGIAGEEKEARWSNFGWLWEVRTWESWNRGSVT